MELIFRMDFNILGILMLFVNMVAGGAFTVTSENVYCRSWGIPGIIETICCLFFHVTAW